MQIHMLRFTVGGTWLDRNNCIISCLRISEIRQKTENKGWRELWWLGYILKRDDKHITSNPSQVEVGKGTKRQTKKTWVKATTRSRKILGLEQNHGPAIQKMW